MIVAAALAAMSLAACGPTTTTEPADSETASVAAAGDCAVLANRNWSAHINMTPMAGSEPMRMLAVTGEVDLPTPGYTVTLDLGPADRSAVPTQQLIVNATAPTGIVPQVVTPYTLNYSGQAIAEQYTAVRIMCGTQQLTELQVTIAH